MYQQTAGVTGAEEAVPQSADARTILDASQSPNGPAASSDVNSTADGSASSNASTGSSDGLTVSGAVGLINIVIGLMLVAAFLLYFSGLMAFITRLGLKSRDQGLSLMNWGVVVLFVLVVLLGIMRYVQFHPEIVFFIVAILVIGFGIWAFVQSSRASAEAEKEDK